MPTPGLLLGNAAGGVVPDRCRAGQAPAAGCVIVGDVERTAARTRCRPTRRRPATVVRSPSSKAYLGDIDGKYWRFNFTPAGAISANLMVDTGQPIYASSALLFVGTTDVYMFFATGSDLLASSAPEGPARSSCTA